MDHPHNHTEEHHDMSMSGGGTQYVCPMHSEIIQERPGVCSLCGMTLVPANINTKSVDNNTSRPNTIARAVFSGLLASISLLGIYFLILTLVSGWSFAQNQFATYLYFIISLVAGFGIQIALYQYIKSLVHEMYNMRKVVGVSGATSTVSMVSCCAHYLVNLLPILGVTGFATLVAQYQIQIFWVGLVFNMFGIVYISSKIIALKKHHE